MASIAAKEQRFSSNFLRLASDWGLLTGSVPMIHMLTQAVSLIAAAFAIGGEELPFAPIRQGVEPMAQRIIHEDCRLLIIGDSNSVKESQPRMLGGLMRTWNPDQWVGRVAPGTVSVNEGVKILSNSTGVDVTPRKIFDTQTSDPVIWSNGQDGFIPTYGMDYVTDGTGLQYWSEYVVARLTRLDEYIGGDWAVGAPMKARLIYAHDDEGIQRLRYHARRGGEEGPFTEFWPFDPDAERPWIDWVEVDVPDGSGEVSAVVQPPQGWLSEGNGGPYPCPQNCEPDKRFFYVTQVLWRTDVPGLQIDAVAEGGFTAEDHLASSGHCDQQAIEDYLAATREPNLFMILLGQNMSTSEHESVLVNYKAHILGIVDRYRSAALAVDPAADPMFLLVSPWQTGSIDRFFEAAQAMYEIAESREDVGFINLMALGGHYEMNRGIYLQVNGVHFDTDAGADYFCGLIWEQIVRAAAGKVDQAVPGDVDVLADAALDVDDAAIRLMQGVHDGRVEIATSGLTMTGWDPEYSFLNLSSYPEGAVQCLPGSEVEFERIGIIGGDGQEGSDGLRRGGCLVAEQASVTLSECHLTGGSADFGGLVSVSGGDLTMRDTKLSGGTATQFGGIVYAQDADITCENAYFVDGAAQMGGGVYFDDCEAVFEVSEMADCISEEDGGGAFIADGSLEMVSTRIRRCEATLGGGLANAGGFVVVESGWIYSNDAVSGGGILNDGGSLFVSSSTLCGNEPDNIVGAWSDLGGSIIELTCGCPADLNGSGYVDVIDLLVVIDGWGPCVPGCLGDLNGDDIVGTDDILDVISSWGECL